MNKLILLTALVSFMIALITTLAHIGKHNNYTAKCNNMLKHKSYQAKYTGEWEEVSGALYCLDSKGTSHKYKARVEK